MTPEDSAHDKELLQRYKRASDLKSASPSDAVRTAILAEGRRLAEQRAKSFPKPLFDVSRRAANDSRWKITALGTAGAALVAALLFAPRLWENSRGPALQTSSVPVAASNAPLAPPSTAPEAAAPAPQAPALQPRSESLKPLDRDRQANLAKAEPAEKVQAEKNYAGVTAAIAASDSSTDNAQGVSANRLRSARAKMAEPLGLLSAVSSGDAPRIQDLLDQGAALNERDELGRTALMLAVIDGRADVVRLLLDRGADPNAADHYGRAPLQMARQANLREIAALLEKSGARREVGR